MVDDRSCIKGLPVEGGAQAFGAREDLGEWVTCDTMMGVAMYELW